MLLSVASDAVDGGGDILVSGVRAAAVMVIAAASIATALTVLSKSPIGRAINWVWRRLVAETVRDWHQEAVTEVIRDQVFPVTSHNTERIDMILAEVSPNGGTSVKDSVDSLVRGQKKIFGRLDDQCVRLEALEDSVTRPSG